MNVTHAPSCVKNGHFRVLHPTAVRPLLGFGRAAGGPIVGDHPNGVALEWDGIAPEGYGWEQPVRLKLYAHQARLYSFWLE